MSGKPHCADSAGPRAMRSHARRAAGSPSRSPRCSTRCTRRTGLPCAGCGRTCTEILGDPARPLLLRLLVRCPDQFRYGFAEPLRRIVGDQALRLAADRELRQAKDPVDTIGALELLPGDELREPLNRLL